MRDISWVCLLVWWLFPTPHSAYTIPLLNFSYDPASHVGPTQWRYVATSPNEWEKYIGRNDINLDVVGNECRSVRRPSPINLVANAACMDTHEILTRKIRPELDCNMTHLQFYATPHTLRADFPHSDEACLRPTIDLPNGYPFRWLAHHVEVHLRAEHVLDGRRYDGELQMYHLGQEDQKRELSSVSVLLDASGLEDHPLLQQYIDRWEEAAVTAKENCHVNQQRQRQRRRYLKGTIAAYNASSTTPTGFAASTTTRQQQQQKQQQKHPTARRALDDPEHATSRSTRQVGDDYAPRRKLFPYDIWPTIHYYRYKGSITSPPCSEIVSWRVLDEPLLISRRQYKALARLLQAAYVHPDSCEYSTAASPLTGETMRPLQELNHEKQELVHCTEENFSFRLYPPNMV